AEDGIRDKLVTGVQTCALPISPAGHHGQQYHLTAKVGVSEAHRQINSSALRGPTANRSARVGEHPTPQRLPTGHHRHWKVPEHRSEERRVGKECRTWWSAKH